MSIHELREKRAARVAEMQGIVAGAEAAKRLLDGNEETRFESLKAEVRGLEGQIGRAETLATFERRADADPMDGRRSHHGMAEIEARFSVGKALTEFRAGKLTGAEAEWASQHRSERDGFTVPVSCLLGEQRAILTTTPMAGPGGNLVATSLGPLIDRPRPQLVVQRLGATTLTGLTDNLDLPRVKESGSVGWVGEHQEGPTDDMVFDKLAMSPHTVTGNYEMSRRMLIQAPQVEQILRRDLGLLIAEQLDKIAVLGTGASSNAPRGILGTPGVRKYSITAANAETPTVSEYDQTFAAMTGGIAAADISGTTGFLANPLVKSTLGKYRDANGGLVYPGGVPVQGERAEWSTQVPADGGVNTNRATVVYGNWSDLLLGYWSSVDILFNPYADSVAKKGGAMLHAFLDADVVLRHVDSFAFTNDVPVYRGSFTRVAA